MAAMGKEEWDGAMTDVVMPEEDGLEFTGELRQRRPGWKVIVMAGDGCASSVDYLKIAKAPGANAALPKPFPRNN